MSATDLITREDPQLGLTDGLESGTVLRWNGHRFQISHVAYLPG
jgi:hypothetical protein